MKPLLLSWWILAGSDAATTHYMLNTGGREVLLPTQNPVAIDGILGAQAWAADRSLRRLHATHPRLALAMGAGLVGVRAYVVQHNMREIARHR
jgi:hypothetical protein